MRDDVDWDRRLDPPRGPRLTPAERARCMALADAGEDPEDDETEPDWRDEGGEG